MDWAHLYSFLWSTEHSKRFMKASLDYQTIKDRFARKSDFWVSLLLRQKVTRCDNGQLALQSEAAVLQTE